MSDLISFFAVIAAAFVSFVVGRFSIRIDCAGHTRADGYKKRKE